MARHPEGLGRNDFPANEPHATMYESAILPKATHPKNDNGDAVVLEFPRRDPADYSKGLEIKEESDGEISTYWRSRHFPSLCFKVREEVRNASTPSWLSASNEITHNWIRNDRPYQSRHFGSLIFE